MASRRVEAKEPTKSGHQSNLLTKEVTETKDDFMVGKSREKFNEIGFFFYYISLAIINVQF